MTLYSDGVFSSIVKLIVVLAVLAASYFLIVKPILHTANNAIDKGLKQSHFQSTSSNRIQRQIERDTRKTTRKVQHQVNSIFHSASFKKQMKLVHCIQRAGGDVNRINACSRRFSG